MLSSLLPNCLICIAVLSLIAALFAQHLENDFWCGIFAGLSIGYGQVGFIIRSSAPVFQAPN